MQKLLEDRKDETVSKYKQVVDFASLDKTLSKETRRKDSMPSPIKKDSESNYRATDFMISDQQMQPQPDYVSPKYAQESMLEQQDFEPDSQFGLIATD